MKVKYLIALIISVILMILFFIALGNNLVDGTDKYGCFIAADYYWDEEAGECIRSWDEKNYCTDEQRVDEFCVMEYRPVCGWFKQDILCVKYPCAQTYDNSCVACHDEIVSYWSEGECPK
ncbi:MAG: hypothetical protein WC548_02925 [Candidatus Pacearchaeota archaeon]